MKKPGFSNTWIGVNALVLCNVSMADETMSAPSHQSGPMPLKKEFQETSFQTEYPPPTKKKKKSFSQSRPHMDVILCYTP